MQEGWPKDLATLPNHEKWTYGGARGIFAESPNRVYLLGGGELPNIKRPQGKRYPDVGPNVQFPVGGLPWRNANQAAPPGAGGSGQDPAKGMELWRGNAPPYRELGVDSRWEHTLIVVNAQGDIIEEWTQWDKMFKRPHAVYVSPYDADKHVWIVDDHTHAIYKFTNDGKQLVQTIGTPNVSGADGTHFNRPTFMAWLPDGTFYVSDGYNGTRVAKFDASGKFLMDFRNARRIGQGNAPGLHEQRARRRRRPGNARVSSSTIATITASRSSTRTASTFPNGRLASAHPACTWWRSARTARWRPSIATRTRC